ncbi:MAG TPA: helix-turn-helix domain-containing protein [Pseudonocardiaceae bacterium]|nr:helix-turn-helix domain-containing protein [Pseudonocardiaceae bacterium]
MSGLPDLELFALSGMRAALASRDIGTVYRLLMRAGVVQRVIAQATGQSQSEVCEILKGRQVMAYDVLERIAAGLDVPREAMGLGYGAYAEGAVFEPGEEADEDLLRRQFQHLFALAGVAAFGTAVPGLGKLTPGLSAGGLLVDTPSRIGARDVAVIGDYTASLRAAARTIGGQAGPATALAGWADSWLGADAAPPVRRALLSALSDLHRGAAWCCHDSCAPSAAYHHFSVAVQLAIDAGDSYRASCALRHAAMMLIDRAQPNNALKLVQLADLHVADAPRDDPQVPVLRSWLAVESALAQAQLSDTESTARRVRSELARARDGYDPPDSHARADMDLVTALVQLHLGALDLAESTASVSVQTFAHGTDRREGVLADITLARLHVQAGEPDAPRLAASAISAVAPLRSGVARAALAPLAAELETRPRADLRELARRARQVATSPA